MRLSSEIEETVPRPFVPQVTCFQAPLGAFVHEAVRKAAEKRLEQLSEATVREAETWDW